ncbi:hydroxymethylglutaryl-CoA lyase [Hyphomonas sp.]|uniref:hydroxymethylglutaryl-CoA lyase n=1 Tax=Hyphomonas sp. TaxID=87 RepID=UPI003568D804
MTKIEIVEVSPRDGLQNEPDLVPTHQKLELIKRAAASGARRIEAVSFVNSKAVPQMADAEEVMMAIRGETAFRQEGIAISGLVLNRRGLDRALKADVDEVNFVVLASETFNKRNQGATTMETMRQLGEAVSVARAEGIPVGLTIGAAFGCPFEGEVPLAKVIALVEQAGAFDLGEIALADTIGVADPLAVEQRVAALRAALPGVPLRCHFHDTRNTGLANAYAAWRSGATTLDASIGGIGGCPFAPNATGNVATEDLVYMFSRMGVETGLSLDSLLAAAEWLQDEVLKKAVPSALLRSGGFPSVTEPARVCV